jgi:hypothetical protein
MADMEDDELLDALGVEVAPLRATSRTPREERIIAGFEDILNFHRTHGRAPQHGEGCDIFERLYAVRLDRLRKLPEARTLLVGLDGAGLLSGTAAEIVADVNDLDEDALLTELGIGDELAGQNDITVLRHVRSSTEKRAAEEIADRIPCVNFEKFQPLFEQVERELKSGVRITRRFGRDTSIVDGSYFIVGGQLAYVAETGETIKTSNGVNDARLRVIYANGTESNLLRRSLQRALYDDTGRRVTDPDMGPLFGDALEPDDIESGTIYVLRSLSTHPFVAEHRELIHKIGVTGGKVEARIADAKKDPTYLLSDVEVIATYKLHNLNRIRLENIFHRLFGAAQLDLTIEDRFGHLVKPREWFLVPLHVIDEAVQRIRDGSIADVLYDPQTAQLVVQE